MSLLIVGNYSQNFIFTSKVKVIWGVIIPNPKCTNQTLAVSGVCEGPRI